MKKVSLLILLVIVLSTVLMAAVPTKMARLTIINKSGDDVFIKLEGSAVTESFYYLTIPSGDSDVPTVKVFTVMQDLYDMTLWQCASTQSSGTLAVLGMTRLIFTPCGHFLGTVDQDFYKDPVTGAIVVNPSAAFLLANPTYVWYKTETGKTQAGEPTQEKVVTFRYLSKGIPSWDSTTLHLYNGYWNWGCYTYYWRIRTYRRPNQCLFRMQF